MSSPMLDSKPDNDGAIIYLPPFRNRRDIDIEITMKDLILRSNGDRLSTYPMRGVDEGSKLHEGNLHD